MKLTLNGVKNLGSDFNKPKYWILLLGLFGFAYGFVFLWGVPYWDDDFINGFSPSWNLTFFDIFLKIINPVSQQTASWGFVDRPLQSLIYKICFLISDRSSWSYIIFKTTMLGALTAVIFMWVVKSSEWAESHSKDYFALFVSSFLPAVFVVTSPPTMGSMIWLTDPGIYAEFCVVLLLFFGFEGIKKIPAEPFSFTKHRKFLIQWLVLFLLVYLTIRLKANIRLVPCIWFVYLLALQPKRWKFNLFFGFACLLVSVPWGPGLFHTPPPFVPGLNSSLPGWQWQPATFSRWVSFFWEETVRTPFQPALGLFHNLGFGILAAIVLKVFVILYLKQKNRPSLDLHHQQVLSKYKKLIFFLIIWAGIISLGASSLPRINYMYSIRYGILLLSPVAIFLGIVMSGVFHRIPSGSLRNSLIGVVCALWSTQIAINVSNSVKLATDHTKIMVPIDSAYQYINDKLPNEQLVHLNDFLGFAYWPDSPPVFKNRKLDFKMGRDKIEPGYYLSWNPFYQKEFQNEFIASYCQNPPLLNQLIECDEFYAFIGRPVLNLELFELGIQLLAQNNPTAAYEKLSQFLLMNPNHYEANFHIGIIHSMSGAFTQMREIYFKLNELYPQNVRVKFNLAFSYDRLNKPDLALAMVDEALKVEPKNEGLLKYRTDLLKKL